VTLCFTVFHRKRVVLTLNDVSGENVSSQAPESILTASPIDSTHSPNRTLIFRTVLGEQEIHFHFSLTSGTSLSPWPGSSFFRYSGAFR
jgi:hypothetical protein